MSTFVGIVFLIILEISTLDAGINIYRKNACKHYLDYPIAPINPNCYHNPNVGDKLVSMIKRNGYPVEIHPVVTEDGFILELYRVKNEGKQPVFIQHGVATNGKPWVDKGNESLAFQCYDHDYDVWIGAIRATTYGKRHLKYTEADNEYWNWNLDDIQKYDITAMLEFIAKNTGRAGDIIYIGHSMGTTVSFMFASDNPERAESLLKGIVAMSPVVYVNPGPAFNILIPFSDIIRSTLSLLGIRSIFRYERFLQAVGDVVCRMLPYSCTMIMQVFAGLDRGNFPPEELLNLISGYFVSMSVDELIHYLQIARDMRFQKFDYGRKNNLEIYGQEIPPVYNLTKIKMDVALFYGFNDVLTPVDRIQRLQKELGSENKEAFQIPLDSSRSFNHIDFEYSRYPGEKFYPTIFETLTKFFKSKKT